MNVVDNLNSVYVIIKLCMSSRRMSLLPRGTLHSDSEQFGWWLLFYHVMDYSSIFPFHAIPSLRLNSQLQ
jgi:hypothetical protein